MRKKNKIERVCEGCGQAFYVSPYRLKAPGNPARFCSMGCRTKAGGWQPFKDHLKVDVPTEQLAKEYQAGDTLAAIGQRYGMTLQGVAYRLRQAGIERRKPTGENLRDPETTRKAAETNRQRRGPQNPRFRDLPMAEIAEAYQDNASLERLAGAYNTNGNTLARRLRQMGVEIRPKDFGRFRRANDGHMVQSDWERVVDDWLFEHGLEHEPQPLCPWPPQGKTRWLADFRVGDTFIEVWGMEGNTQYDARRLDKVARYKAAGARLIEIFPHHVLDHDFSPLEALLPTT